MVDIGVVTIEFIPCKVDAGTPLAFPLVAVAIYQSVIARRAIAVKIRRGKEITGKSQIPLHHEGCPVSTTEGGVVQMPENSMARFVIVGDPKRSRSKTDDIRWPLS